jgi:hypothetical protein
MPLMQRGAHLRVRVPHQGERRHEHPLAGREVEADAQPAAGGRAGLPGRLDGPVKLPEQRPGFPAEHLTSGRQPHTVRGPGNELHADSALELLQLQAQRRLRDVQPRGGPAKVQLLGENKEGGDVPQFHSQPSI